MKKRGRPSLDTQAERAAAEAALIEWVRAPENRARLTPEQLERVREALGDTPYAVEATYSSRTPTGSTRTPTGSTP